LRALRGAAYVYKIKFESTQRAEQVAKLRTEIRREHDAIAALRAEWSRLDNPARIQELARRHLALKPIEQRQFDRLDQLPERPTHWCQPAFPIRSFPDCLAGAWRYADRKHHSAEKSER